MNLFSAMVQDGKVAVLNDQQEVAFQMPLTVSGATGKFSDGKRIMVGVRPHRIHLVPGEQVEGTSLVGEVTSNHWLGDQCQVGFQVRGCHVIAVGGRDVQAPMGSQVPVAISSEAVRIFDADSGAAIEQGPESAASHVA
jgi:ABC-type sugar transport system ATPase subunit